MTELNESQARAVAHPSGPILVFAGAGSGKTRTITYRVAQLLSHGIAPYRILSVTFTNKAAEEMKSRLRQMVGEALADELWMGTFHSVCARLLRRYHQEVGLERNFVIYDESDQKATMNRLLKELHVSDRELPVKVALNRIEAFKQRGHGPDDIHQSSAAEELLAQVYRRYQAALSASNAVDFSDLLLYMMRLAESTTSAAGHELRERFDHVLVDEFQDTNLIQYRLVKALSARSRNLCVVGDDDQSIYRWRGADVRIIRGFRKDFPDAAVIKLEQNYRSTANIVRTALSIIERSAEREPKKLWTDQALGEPVVVRSVANERDEALFVVRGVQQRLRAGIDARNVAVFYRIHAQSRVLEEAFRAESVPYQIVGGTRFFDRAEVKDILAYLRLVDNPRSEADFFRIINVPARGIGNKTLDRVVDVASDRGLSPFAAAKSLANDPNLPSAARRKLDEFTQLVDVWREASTSLAPHALAEMVVEQSGYRQAMIEKDTAQADARLGNVEELLGSIAEFESDATWSGAAPTLTDYLERISLLTATDNLRDVPKVSLMTVHAAKGLEFDTVFLTGMEDQVFPYVRLHSDEHEDLDDERRLAYVAVTRARERLVLTCAAQRTLFGQTRYLSRSEFILDIPEQCMRLELGDAVVPSAPRPMANAVAETSRPRPLARGSGSGTGFAETTRVVDTSAFDDLPPDELEFRPGQPVFHARFGKGRVDQVVKGGQSPAVIATFPGFGSRKILARFLGAAKPR